MLVDAIKEDEKYYEAYIKLWLNIVLEQDVIVRSKAVLWGKYPKEL